MEALIAHIITHPAFSHPVFAALAERKIPRDSLEKYLRFMGAFCELSRNPGRIVDRLRDMGFPEEATEIDAIFQSESDHRRQFALMVIDLLELSEDRLEDWDCFASMTVPEGVREATWQLAEREIIMTRGELGEALGVMLVVELAAHRSIIPGEVKAFDESGFYTLTVAGASYLDGHSGEDGAEYDNEKRMIRVIASLQHVDGIREGIERGVNRFLPALNGFYTDLHAAIT